jgi:hypothetical protein
MQKSAEPKVDSFSELATATILSLLHEYRDGRDPLVPYGLAHPCLVALGRPLSEQGVRDLVVDTRTLNNCSVARLSDFVKAADEYIGRRLARPNLKAAAAAKARAAKAGARQHEAA